MSEPLKVLYADVETTGLDPLQHDIVQLALIVEIDGKIVEEREWFMQPKRFDNIEPKALETNGLTIEKLKSFPLQKDVFPTIPEMLDKYVDRYDRYDKFWLAGYNVRFDVSFIGELFRKNANDYLGSYIRWQDIDILYLNYIHAFLGTHNLPNYRLETVAKFYGIKHDAHDALSDAKAVRELVHLFLMPYRRVT